MFIPPQKIQHQLKATAQAESKVRLKSSHLLIAGEVAQEIFGNDRNANVVYYSERRTLMIAPTSDDLFKKLHKAKQHMLKDRNAKGDKAIALHELLIDHEINSTERDLEFEAQAALKILNVKL
ncbi:MAG: hypothetical protein AAF573_00190 [Bacteroidota bacterium]